MLGSSRTGFFGKATSVIDFLLILTLASHGLTQFSRFGDLPSSNPAKGGEETRGLNSDGLAAEEKHLQDKNRAKKEEVESLNKKIEECREQLASLPPDSPPSQSSGHASTPSGETGAENARLESEIGRIRKVIEALESKKNSLEKEKSLLEEMQNNLAGRDDELRKLRTQCNSLAEQIAALQEQLRRPSGQVVNVESTPLVLAATARSPVYLTLADGRVAPLREPFFSFQSEMVGRDGCYETVIEATRVKDGESLDQALRKNSAFSKTADEVQPKEQYVALIIDSSSFATFRAIRNELRNRGIAYGWEPMRCDVVRLSMAGQVIAQEE